MMNEKAASVVGATESGEGEKTIGQCFTPKADFNIITAQKQRERAERLLFLLLRAAIQNGGEIYIPYSILSCIALIPENEVRELCDFDNLFGDEDG